MEGQTEDDLLGLVRAGDTQRVRLVLRRDGARQLMQCNGSKQTPLTLALLRGEAGEDMVHELLCSGAAESVFVKGYLPKLLTCTLPQAINHPTCQEPSLPYMLTSPHIVSQIDTCLANYIEDIQDRERNATTTCTAQVASNEPATFVVGDIVRLKRGLRTSSLANEYNWYLAEKCLGDASWGRLGLVTSVVLQGSANTSVQVSCLSTGVAFDYLARDLVYADHSSIGKYDPEDIATVEAPAFPLALTPNDVRVSSGTSHSALVDNNEFTCWTSSSTKLPHEIEVLLPSGCRLHVVDLFLDNHGDSSPQAMDVLVGKSPSDLHIIKSLKFAVARGWHQILSVSQCRPMEPRNIRVLKLVILSNLKGYTSKLTSIRVTVKRPSYPLALGEQVILDPSFSVNDSDGWCLGNAYASRVGTVVALTDTDHSTQFDASLDGSELLVLPSDASQAQRASPAVYRSSWLKRLMPQVAQFALGQRVQLNCTAWFISSAEALGKCLGTPANALYGVVCGVGSLRNGVQRNIEVVVLNGKEESGRLSLYPAYMLSPAVRSMILTFHDKEMLVTVVTSLFTSAFPNATIDARKVVEQSGLQVWSNLLRVHSVRTVTEAYSKWSESRRPWNDEDKIQQAIAHAGVNNAVAAHYSSSVLRLTVPCGPRERPWSCSVCAYERNEPASSFCGICGNRGVMWSCKRCGYRNKPGNALCVQCQCTASLSKEEWRARLRVGDKVDAEDSVRKWYESIIIEIGDCEMVKVHFKGWLHKWNAWIPRKELHPLYTYSNRWRENLAPGAEIEYSTENSSKRGWFIGVVTAVDHSTATVKICKSDKTEFTCGIDSEEFCELGTHCKAQPNLKAGDRIGASKAGSKYYPGNITRLNSDGTYAVLYDDGDRHSSVSSERICKLTGHAVNQQFNVGDRVTAPWKRSVECYPGRITKVNSDDTCAILYTDGYSDASVPSKAIKKIKVTTDGATESLDLTKFFDMDRAARDDFKVSSTGNQVNCSSSKTLYSASHSGEHSYMRWTFRVKSNAVWAVGIVPESVVDQENALLEGKDGCTRLLNSGKGNRKLSRHSMNGKLVEATVDTERGMFTIHVDTDIISFEVRSPVRLAFLGCKDVTVEFEKIARKNYCAFRIGQMVRISEVPDDRQQNTLTSPKSSRKSLMGLSEPTRPPSRVPYAIDRSLAVFTGLSDDGYATVFTGHGCIAIDLRSLQPVAHNKLVIGMDDIVERGPDWARNDADGGQGSMGRVVSEPNDKLCVSVEWFVTGRKESYRWGKGGKYDIKIIYRTLYMNRAGFIVSLGPSADPDEQYYCGRCLDETPQCGEDIICEPDSGYQCKDCAGYTKESPPLARYAFALCSKTHIAYPRTSDVMSQKCMECFSRCGVVSECAERERPNCSLCASLAINNLRTISPQPSTSGAVRHVNGVCTGDCGGYLQQAAYTMSFVNPARAWGCECCEFINKEGVVTCDNCGSRRPFFCPTLHTSELDSNTQHLLTELRMDEVQYDSLRMALHSTDSADADQTEDVISTRSRCSTNKLIQLNNALREVRLQTYYLEPQDRSAFEPIEKLHQLIQYSDQAGNTSAHHAAMIGLERTLNVLVAAGASLWTQNHDGITPAFIVDLVGLSGQALELCSQSSDVPQMRRVATLHKALKRHSLVPMELVRALLMQPEEYENPCSALAAVLEHCAREEGEQAVALAQGFVHRGLPDSRVYLGIALHWAGYGSRAVQLELDAYLQEKLIEAQAGRFITVDPLYFYARYLLWVGDSCPTTKIARLTAANALTVVRCFPRIASRWLRGDDNIDMQIHDWDLPSDENSEDASDEMEFKDSNPPEDEWELAKRAQGVSSPSMDMLMRLTGLKEVKNRAMGVLKSILLSRFQPSGLNASISMNFLFVGNSGCGKTTVVKLLAGIMTELGFRLNSTPLLTSAADILRLSDPLTEFSKQVENAIGGVVFIDDVHSFKPSSSHSNVSNGILDYLLRVCEAKAHTTSFILAGHRDDIMELLKYNDGFRSRFPFTFEFADYTEYELRKIFTDMVADRGFRLQTRQEAGVPIAKLLCQRIAKGAGKKGFGNARECRARLELAILNQSKRLGADLLVRRQLHLSEYRMLTRVDVLGDETDIGAHLLKELDSMVGLKQVKQAMRGLLHMQIQNYERENRGEKPEVISLNRIFMGNPGTGKTTVARLYGRMLKELGFLSDGDLVCVTASDLVGDVVGAASTRTASVIDSAKGKVLFIDEAYIMDPSRRNNMYGGNVVDTLVEKIEGSAGADMAVLLAGYEPDMRALIRNCGNPGFARRFNVDEALMFDDFTDSELKEILKGIVAQAGLVIDPVTATEVIRMLAEERRLPAFGNAGAVESLVGRAKVNKALRLANAFTAYREAEAPAKKLKLAPPHPDRLELADFVRQDTRTGNTREMFSGLYHVEHVHSMIDEMEALIRQGQAENKTPAQLLAGCHMIFLGPPGTGKSTVARRFGRLFKTLGLLSRDEVVEVTGRNLQAGHVGGTVPRVLELVRQALGGILLIDEAYGIHPSAGTYGADAVQALVDAATSLEFKGNLVVILAGYANEIELLLSSNPGLRSRFDKKRLHFCSWTADQATETTIAEITKDNKTMTYGAEALLSAQYAKLAALPGWASARDVFDTILPALYGKRAVRLSLAGKSEGASGARTLSAGAYEAAPYESDDIIRAFECCLRSRSLS